MNVIYIAGAPEVGKDSLAFYLKAMAPDSSKVFIYPVKTILRKWVKRFYELTDEQFNWYYQRENKDRTHTVFGGKTMREAMIHVSQRVVKPTLGDDYFGKTHSKEVSRLKIEHGDDIVVIVPDAGSEVELHTSLLHSCASKSLLVRAFREGYQYTDLQDGRSMIPFGFEGLPTLDFRTDRMERTEALEDKSRRILEQIQELNFI